MRTTKKIVALSGWKGSGKDTVGRVLTQDYGYVRHSFADRLKQMVEEQYNVPFEYMNNYKKEMPLTEYPVVNSDDFSNTIHQLLAAELLTGYWTPRALCILEGSVKRSVNAQFWTRSVIASIIEADNDLHVITDLRYKSEANILRDAFGSQLLLARINRFSLIDTKDPSERDLDDFPFDLTLSNHGTLEQLQAIVHYSITGGANETNSISIDTLFR